MSDSGSSGRIRLTPGPASQTDRPEVNPSTELTTQPEEAADQNKVDEPQSGPSDLGKKRAAVRAKRERRLALLRSPDDSSVDASLSPEGEARNTSPGDSQPPTGMPGVGGAAASQTDRPEVTPSELTTQPEEAADRNKLDEPQSGPSDLDKKRAAVRAKRERRVALLRSQDASSVETGDGQSTTGITSRAATTRAARALKGAPLQAVKQSTVSRSKRPLRADVKDFAPSVAPKPTSPLTAQINFLPKRGRSRSYGSILSFILCVILPTIAVSVYFFVYASNQYAAGFRFMVRDAQSAASGISQSSGLSGMFGSGATPNPSENYMVTEFARSRQAVDELQKRIDLIQRYTSPDIDWWARFDSTQPIEKFERYWQRMMSAAYDQITGLGVVEVRAFKPEDAYLIAKELVSISEELVNEVASRPQRDAVRFAEEGVAKADARLQDVRNRITEYRNTEQLIDPQSSIVTSNILLAQTLRANLNQLQTDLTALSGQQPNPNSPVRIALQARIKATSEQLAKVEAEVGHVRGLGASNPLSKVVAKFEALDLERQFAQTLMLGAMQNLSAAQANAIQQHVYVTTFVHPALPGSSTYPKRLLSSLAAGFGFFLVWLVGLLLVRSLREHLT